MRPLLKAESLRKSYDGRLVLDLGFLEVQQGETLGVLGPNGAGKSTLVRLLNLVEKPDVGAIWFDGIRVGRGDVAARRRMAGVFQRPHMLRGTVYDNVAYGLKLRRLPGPLVAAHSTEALELLGLSRLAGHDARTLSGGEAQRVALARALAIRPEVLFLDEPANNLDPLARRDFRRDLRAIVKGGHLTVVYVTHSLEEARSACDRVMVMKDGQVLQAGPRDEVFRAPAPGFVERFLGCEGFGGEGGDRIAGDAASGSGAGGSVHRLRTGGDRR